jgi:hypothetical protein
MRTRTIPRRGRNAASYQPHGDGMANITQPKSSPRAQSIPRQVTYDMFNNMTMEQGECARGSGCLRYSSYTHAVQLLVRLKPKYRTNKGNISPRRPCSSTPAARPTIWDSIRWGVRSDGVQGVRHYGKVQLNELKNVAMLSIGGMDGRAFSLSESRESV